jgi:Beta-galactosidase
MKISFSLSLLLAGPLCSLAVSAQPRSDESGGPRPALVHRTFREVDTLLANPGQGWMSQAHTPKADPRFPYSVVYIRFNWADIEPEQGKYNWQVIDDVIAAWKPRKATVAFRVMTCNAHSAGYYASPKWLFDSGCKGRRARVAAGRTRRNRTAGTAHSPGTWRV